MIHVKKCGTTKRGISSTIILEVSLMTFIRKLSEKFSSCTDDPSKLNNAASGDL
jgi:hypothetical protein